MGRLYRKYASVARTRFVAWTSAAEVRGSSLAKAPNRQDGRLPSGLGAREGRALIEFAAPHEHNYHQPMVGCGRAIKVQRFGWGQIGV